MKRKKRGLRSMESRIEISGEQAQKELGCKHAFRYRLKSVYCQKKEAWLAENYCRYMCNERETPTNI
jgi:hypothetical protein